MRIGNLVRVGRFSPEQTTRFGEALGSVGYVAFGPVAVVVSLPKRYEKPDRLLSIFDLNEHLRRLAEADAQLTES